MIPWVVGALVGLYGLHRLALWLESRGWLYYIKSRGRVSRGSFALGVASAVDPTVRHLIEAERKVEIVEEEGVGSSEPPDAGSDAEDR